MNDHVVGALHEGGINREKRFQTLGGQTAGEKRGMLFGDADIEVTIGMGLGEVPQAGAAGHGGGNGHDLLIRIGEPGQRFADDLGIGGRGRGRGLTRLRLVLAQPVEFVGLFDGRLVALALLGQDMQENRLLLVLEKFESADEQGNIVPVDRAVITQAKFFKDHAGNEQTLDPFLHLVREMG